MDKKIYENYHTAHKTTFGVKPLGIIFEKVDRYIRKHNRNKYLVLFPSNENYEIVFDRNIYFTMLKSNILDVCFHKYMEIKTNSDDALPLGKTLNISDAVILIKYILIKIIFIITVKCF